MPIHIPHSSYRHKKTIRSASIAPLKIPQLIEYFGPVIPLDFLGYFLLNPHSEACIGSFPVPPDSYDTLQHRISGSKKTPEALNFNAFRVLKALFQSFAVVFHQIKDLGKLCISPARRIKDTGRALFLRCCCLLCRYSAAKSSSFFSIPSPTSKRTTFVMASSLSTVARYWATVCLPSSALT